MNTIQTKTYTLEQDAFFKREVSIWGEDHVYDLIDRGYFPIKFEDGTWSWIMRPFVKD